MNDNGVLWRLFLESNKVLLLLYFIMCRSIIQFSGILFFVFLFWGTREDDDVIDRMTQI